MGQNGVPPEIEVGLPYFGPPRSRRPMTRFRLPAFLVALATLTLFPGTAAQETEGAWSLLDASPYDGYRFEDGDFIDPSTGWIVNGSGEVWKTADGGASWDQLGNYQSLYLRSVAFADAQRGAIGTLWSQGPLWWTTDGGETFVNAADRITGPVPSGICGLQAVSDEVMVGVGWFAGPSHFIKTTDGGQTWSSRDISDVVGSLVDLHFWDEQRGVVVGGSDALNSGSRAVVALTEDGGETWSVRHTGSPGGPAAQWAWKVSFPTPTTGYVAVEYGGGGSPPATVLKTTDGGLSWTELAIPGSQEPEGLQGVGFITADIGWASGRGTTSRTTDGGQTWQQIDLDGQVNRFEFFGDTLAYAMGTRIYQLNRTSTTAVEGAVQPVASGLDAVYPNPTAGPLDVAYRLPEAGAVDLAVYDLLGRRVATLASGTHAAGANGASWDGRDGTGAAVAPGVYVVRLRSEGRADAQRVTVVGP